MEPSKPFHVCSCGRQYTEAGWRFLQFVGIQADDVEALEIRNCLCGSTRAVVVWRAPGQEAA